MPESMLVVKPRLKLRHRLAYVICLIFPASMT
jgi:hypothetical protein